MIPAGNKFIVVLALDMHLLRLRFLLRKFMNRFVGWVPSIRKGSKELFGWSIRFMGRQEMDVRQSRLLYPFEQTNRAINHIWQQEKAWRLRHMIWILFAIIFLNLQLVVERAKAIERTEE